MWQLALVKLLFWSSRMSRIWFFMTSMSVAFLSVALIVFIFVGPALLSNAELTASNVFRIWFSRLVENIPILSFIIFAVVAFLSCLR